MSSIVALFTKEDSEMSIASTAKAPAKAPARVPIYPETTESKAIPNAPPPSSITIATPKLAPVETPRIDGSASGLLNTVCSRSPQTANAAPANMAVTIVGIRD